MNKFSIQNSKLVSVVFVINFLLLAGCGMGGSITVKGPTINFDTDGGNTIASITVKRGEKATVPTAPTKKDFKFIEWQLDGKAFNFNTLVSKNISLKARWVKNSVPTFVVTFNTDGGNTIASALVVEKETTVAPKEPTKKDFKFVEWQLDGKIFNFNTPITKNIALEAIWLELLYATSTDWETKAVTGGVKIEKYKGKDTNVVIPTTIDNKKVITLRANSSSTFESIFYKINSGSIITIDLSKAIYLASIEEYAFIRCTSLTDVKIYDAVTSIGQYAFSGCNSLTSITIPDSVTSIGVGAFSDCNSLKEVTLSNTLTSIGDYAFSGCNSLTSITIPDSVTSIGKGAFSGTKITAVTLPNGCTYKADSFENSFESTVKITGGEKSSQ